MSQPEQMYKLVLTAEGQVHDADGNLLSSEQVELEMEAPLTADEVRDLTNQPIKGDLS